MGNQCNHRLTLSTIFESPQTRLASWDTGTFVAPNFAKVDLIKTIS